MKSSSNCCIIIHYLNKYAQREDAMKYNVFIDGAEGTTGLKIHQYFQQREDIQVLKIEEEKRKDM